MPLLSWLCPLCCVVIPDMVGRGLPFVDSVWQQTKACHASIYPIMVKPSLPMAVSPGHLSKIFMVFPPFSQTMPVCLLPLCPWPQSDYLLLHKL